MFLDAKGCLLFLLMLFVRDFPLKSDPFCNDFYSTKKRQRYILNDIIKRENERFINFQVGDRVLIFEKNLSYKFSPNWLLNYTIEEKLSVSAFLVTNGLHCLKMSVRFLRKQFF
ncbi:hypothetical protein M153_5330002512 [Pseudoloma neurophilia]|uniref:Transposable element n=1 Tax=Pseudoloma neurophilia TaxID=146866 RepID=A0A0R0M326_9MICR|nr:hypothetical protein M153_5330002512 [Pseudoloma neurophilia]